MNLLHKSKSYHSLKMSYFSIIEYSMMDSQDWGYCETGSSMELNIDNSGFLRILQ
jgi:hypothetical protein